MNRIPPTPTPGAANPPLSRERIEAVMEAQGWVYSIDANGDLGGMWGDWHFLITLRGPEDTCLNIMGLWGRKVPPAVDPPLLRFINEFHGKRFWPMAYTQDMGGELAVFAEVTTNLEHGVADDQLTSLITCGIVWTSIFFDALDERFPFSRRPR